MVSISPSLSQKPLKASVSRFQPSDMRFSEAGESDMVRFSGKIRKSGVKKFIANAIGVPLVLLSMPLIPLAGWRAAECGDTPKPEVCEGHTKWNDPLAYSLFTAAAGSFGLGAMINHFFTQGAEKAKEAEKEADAKAAAKAQADPPKA